MPEIKPASPGELRATVRIDAEPGGKKFQGVWLEFSDDRRWVVDYRPRDFWRSFEDRAVLVTGTCYQPFGQAISATHFKVERMRFAAPSKQSVPFVELGPEVVMTGVFVEHVWPAGTKLAGTKQLQFRDEAGSGTTYWIAGTLDTLAVGPATIEARTALPDRAYAAGPGGEQIWILRAHAPDWRPDPAHAPKLVPCP